MKWTAAVLVALGAALVVKVQIGPMAIALGGLSVVVWIVTGGIGALQSRLLADLAGRFPTRAGGTAAYAHEAFGDRTPFLGAVAGWGYWFGWTPGIAVNLVLAASYLKASVWPGANTLAVVVLVGAVLYGLNAIGLKIGMWLAALTAGLAIVPLVGIGVATAINPSLLSWERVVGSTPPNLSWTSTATWLLLLKWGFVAAWTAYGAEMASTIIAEIRSPSPRQSRIVMRTSSILCLSIFTLVPLVVLAAVGASGLSGDPALAFLPLAQAAFGSAGAKVVAVMLAGALICGAQAFIVGSSRTVYQMSLDGNLPRFCSRTSRRGTPIGSIVFDVTVIATLLIIFGTRVINVVAAANVGYLTVFVILPLAYIVLLRRGVVGFTGAKTLAIALFVVNLVLLVVGGWQWGASVVLTGCAVMVGIVPLYILGRKALHKPTALTAEMAPASIG